GIQAATIAAEPAEIAESLLTSAISANSALTVVTSLPWQFERDVLARVTASAQRDDDVLLAFDRIRHRRSALRCGHPDRSDFLPARLVVRAKHRPTRVLWCRRHLRVAHDDKRLRDHQSDAGCSSLSGLRNVLAAKCRMIAHVVWCVAVRHLPHDFTA